MIYTCYDMIQDCRGDRAEGWSYFLSNYVPVIRKLVAHYGAGHAGDNGTVEKLLRFLRRPESRLFASLDPAPERWFVAELRQRVLVGLAEMSGTAVGEPGLDLETLGKALAPFTLVEKQAAWLETMRYTPEKAGVLLRMDPKTVGKIREKAAELLRQNLDTWRRTLLADEGSQLGVAAAAAQTPDCVPAKAFLDVLDGRTTWRGREELERHVIGCWHCIDHFCRLAEVLELVRGVTPLSEAEAEPLRAALGLGIPKKRGWKAWFGG